MTLMRLWTWRALEAVVAETFDELLQMCRLSSLLRDGGLRPHQGLLPQHDELGEAAHVLGHLSARDLDHAVGHAIDEVAVVAHEQQRPAPVRKVVLQPCDGVNVEVVGRLVEGEEVGLGQEQPCQRNPHPPAAAQL